MTNYEPTIPAGGDDEIFERLTDELDYSDIGLQLFTGRMLSAEQALRESNEVTMADVKSTFIDFDQKWELDGVDALYTGKLYLLLESLSDDELHRYFEGFEVFEDEWGKYIITDSMNVTSSGIIGCVIDHQAEDKKVDPSKFRFAFTYNHNVKGRALKLLSFPHDLSNTQYTELTSDGISHILHESWPDEMEAVDGLLDNTIVDPAVLCQILRQIEQLIAPIANTSDEAREWISSYIDANMAFDKEFPCNISAQGLARYYDIETEDWVPFTFQKGATLAGNIDGMNIMPHQGEYQDEARLLIFIAVPNSLADAQIQDETVIGIPVRGISEIRSLRPRQACLLRLKAESYAVVTKLMKNLLVDRRDLKCLSLLIRQSTMQLRQQWPLM